MRVLDTATVSPRERLDLMVESLAGHAGATSFTPRSDRDEPHLTMDTWDLGAVTFYDAACSAHTLHSRGRLPADAEPVVLVTYALKGVGVHTQPGRQVEARPGAIWATDRTAPYVHRISDTRTLTTKVPMSAVGVPADLYDTTLLRLPESPLAPLFINHIRQLRQVVDQIDPMTESALGTATLSIARAMFASVVPEHREGRAALADVLLIRMKAFVRQHLGDPDLNAELVATAHHVSVRHLYKTFARAGLRLEQWIIDERIARAAEDLAGDPAAPVGQIAHRWGFTSVSHFTTRFRATYGVAPREWRALNGQQS